MGNSDKSDGEYSYIEDKGNIGFIDIDNCKSVCAYSPSEESQIVQISVPFPLVDGKPQSGIVGKTKFDSITIKNITGEALELWSVSIYDSKPEDAFTLSILKPPSANSDEEYLLDFVESFALEDRVLRANQELTVWLSCKPKEIGLHSAAVHFNVGDEFIERLVFVLAENQISQSLSSTRPYQRPRRQKQDVVNIPAANTPYIMGRRPGDTSKGSSKGWPQQYPIPDAIRVAVNSRQIPGTINEGLTQTNYSQFFQTLLAMEEIKLEEDMSAYDMEGVILRERRNQFLSLEVPGLAERRPSLVYGDYIFVRHTNDDEIGNARYQGHIMRVEAEEVYLRFVPKFYSYHREGNLYNVQFTYNRMGMRRLYHAVEHAEKLDRNFLFPSPSTKMRMQIPKPLAPKLLTLNQDQKKCVETILACRGGCPHLIHGPPGTGKTMTLIEAMLQIYATKRNARMLVCAPSNSAADHILERLIYQTSVEIQKTEIFRLNAYTRPLEDVNPNILDFCCVEEDVFKCPSRWNLAQCRIIISTYTSSSLIYAEGIKRGHFSYFFLDEAGQASEPETMIPLSNLYSKDAVVVLAGDPMQLGPVIFSKDAESHGLGTSYLERLCGYDLYRNGNKNFMTKLVRNYRTHKEILRLPSDLFYEGELIPCKEERTSSASLPWGDLILNKSFPLLFMGIQGCDEREGSNPSWFNRIEASKVVEIVGHLIDNGMKGEDIGVITPYRQQVSKIRSAIEGLDIADIKVGSVEQFQGQEREVIVISTVRSTVKHHEFDRLHYLGFLSNPRRFNVAITRAKSFLVVVGNPHILCKDPNWNDLLWYCVDNNSYKGCFLPEREIVNAEGASWTGGSKWSGKGDGWQTSETPWDQGDNWKSSEGNWDDNWVGDGSNNRKPSQDNWDEGGDNGKPSGGNWGGDGNNNWELEPSQENWDDDGDNRKTSEGNWGGEVSNKWEWEPSQDNGDEKGDNGKPSGGNWGSNNWEREPSQDNVDKKGDSRKPSGGKKGDNKKPSEGNWGSHNWECEPSQDGDKKWDNRKPFGGKKGDNRKPSGGNWGSNNWEREPSQDNGDKKGGNGKPYGGRSNNWDKRRHSCKASEVPRRLDVERPDNRKPSDVPWCLDVDRPDDWQPSEVPWTVDEHWGKSTPLPPFIPSDIPWDCE